MSLCAGQTFTLSGWVRNLGDNCVVAFAIDFQPVTTAAGTVTDWTLYQAGFQSPRDNPDLDVLVECRDAGVTRNIYVDNISITPNFGLAVPDTTATDTATAAATAAAMVLKAGPGGGRLAERLRTGGVFGGKSGADGSNVGNDLTQDPLVLRAKNLLAKVKGLAARGLGPVATGYMGM